MNHLDRANKQQDVLKLSSAFGGSIAGALPGLSLLIGEDGDADNSSEFSVGLEKMKQDVLMALLEALGRHSVIWCVDDAQYLDPESRDLLSWIMSELPNCDLDHHFVWVTTQSKESSLLELSDEVMRFEIPDWLESDTRALAGVSGLKNVSNDHIHWLHRRAKNVREVIDILELLKTRGTSVRRA